MLRVSLPSARAGEWRYITDVLLREFLGLDYSIQFENRQAVRITLDDEFGELSVANILLAVPEDHWLTPASMPKVPAPMWRVPPPLNRRQLRDIEIPALYAEPFDRFQCSPGSVHLPLDIFGASFWFLTRYEEVVSQTYDVRGRFTAQSSIAWQQGFLMRPVVDEMVELLWNAIQCLWPRLTRRERRLRIRSTHDVDEPYEMRPFNLKRAFRRVGGEILLRRAPMDACRTGLNIGRALLGLPFHDRCDTYDYAMDQCERYGASCAFYFICGQSASDPRYDVTEPLYRKLISHILNRGHEVGLHPGYDTFLDPEKLRDELKTLQEVLERNGGNPTNLGGRQHYLRWRAPDTWQQWEDAGLAYDSSVGYAEHVGFRCGTCQEFPVFNVRTRQALRLRERPLMLMEGTMIGPHYMRLSVADAMAYSTRVAAKCREFQGSLVLLWHNDQLRHQYHRRIYTALLASGAN